MDRGWTFRFVVVVSAIVLAGLALWPSVHEGAPGWVVDTFRNRIALGLDIRGGMRVLYTVDVDEAVRDKRDFHAARVLEQLCRRFEICDDEDPATREQLAETRERVSITAAGLSSFRVVFEDAADLDEVDREFVSTLGPIREAARTATAVTLEISDDEIERLRSESVDMARETIERRIGELGLVEATITARDTDIAVEIPGASPEQFENIRRVIAQTARLEFKICDDEATFVQDLSDLPVGIERTAESVSVGTGRSAQPRYLYSTHDVLIIDGEPVLGSVEELEQDTDETGEGAVRIVRVVFAPVDGGARTYREGEFDAYYDSRQWLTHYIDTLDVPEDHQLAVGDYDDEDNPGWRTYYLHNRAELTGEVVEDASVSTDDQTGNPVVNVTFDRAGATLFERVTGENVQRRMAIVLDDRVASAPNLQERIGGGRARITLGDTRTRTYEQILNEASELALVLRSGALPAPIEEYNRQMIGPTLGADSVRQGAIGALVGIGLVLLFMMVYYEVAGVVAAFLVALNVVFLLAIMAAANGTLTLPGIAGIALTVGMAVDANVLITERIREELRLGKSARSAVEQGFGRAFWSIFDSQVTTALAGVVLYQYGTGPLKGFALTLIIGIITSLFTGVFCSKVAFDWLVRGLKIQRLRVG